MSSARRSSWIIGALWALVFAGLGPSTLFAQTVTATAQVQIQPDPIPMNSSTGSPYVGVLEINLSCTGATAYIGQVVIRPRPADTLGLSWADATNTHLFLNSQSPLKYRAMNSPANLGPVGTLTVSYNTPTAGDLTIDIGEAATIAAGATRTLWVAFSYPASLVSGTPKAVNCYATSVSYGSSVGGNKVTSITPPDPTSRTVQIIDYHTTFSAGGLVNDPPLTVDQYDQGNINIQVAKLTFGSATQDEDLAGVSTYKQLSTIQLRYLGERTADVAANSTSLYLDDGDGSFDAGDSYVASNVFSGNTLTFGPFVADAKIQFAQGPKTYLVVVNIDTNAVLGNHIGFDIANPSTSIVFANVPAGTLGSDVSGSYNQKGYITDPDPTPTTLNTFTISEYVPPDTTPPTVSVNLPTGATLVPLATDITIVFSENMTESTVPPAAMANVTFTIDGGAAVPIDAPVYNDTTNTLTLHPTGGLLSFSTTYRVTVKGGVGGVADEATPTPNVMASDFTWTFTTVPPTPPTVASTNPEDGNPGASRTDPIVITFSETVVGFTKDDFTLTGPGISGPADWSVLSFDGQTATMSHTDLGFGGTYTATIGTGIADSEGTAMAAPYQWTFATASAIAPVVTAVSPVDNAVGVSRAATIRATFSKNIDDGTIEGSVAVPSTTFLVYTDANRNGAYDAGTDTPVAGAVDYNGPTLTATFTPAAEMPYAAYVVRLTTGIEDPNGTPLATEYTWNFSTIPAVGEPIAANNRIVPGGSDRVVIFIPQPTTNASDKVTVQVFTPSGKRVATLVNAESYSALLARLPLLWDGTNGKAQKLGPGLYFIRITAPGYSRVLKVMIVR